MLEAVISLKIPDNWMTEIAAKYPAAIKVLDRLPFAKTGVRDLVEISAPGEILDEILQDIRKDPLVLEATVTAMERNKVIGAVATKRCDVCRTMVESNCFLISAQSKRGGAIEWTLVTTDRAAIQELFAKLQRLRCEVRLVRISEINDREALTDRQLEITMIALERGYFDYPKRISLRELARMFSISTSTLSEILRKGQRKIVLEYFRERKSLPGAEET